MLVRLFQIESLGLNRQKMPEIDVSEGRVKRLKQIHKILKSC